MADNRIKLTFGSERIIPASGLGVVGAMLGKSSFRKHCDRQKVNPKRSQPQIRNGDILLTCIGLPAQGKTACEAVREFDDDSFGALTGRIPVNPRMQPALAYKETSFTDSDMFHSATWFTPPLGLSYHFCQYWKFFWCCIAGIQNDFDIFGMKPP